MSLNAFNWKLGQRKSARANVDVWLYEDFCALIEMEIPFVDCDFLTWWLIKVLITINSSV